MSCDWQFRDQKVPAFVCHLLKTNKITASDLLLSFVVDSLVKPQGDESGLGCYATNDYLGKAIGSNPVYVSQRISYLSELGIILIIPLSGKRYLEMEWSRTAEERKTLDGEYGEANRKAFGELLKRQPIGFPKQPIGKPIGGGIGKPKNGVYENLYHNSIDKYKGIKKEGGQNSPPLTQFQTWAKQLRIILRSKKPAVAISKGSINHWAEKIKSLWTQLDQDTPRIETLLNQYAKNINSIDKQKQPVIASIEQFCDRYQWLEDIFVNKPKETEGLPEGKIRRKIIRKYHRDVKRITNPERGTYTLDTLKREFTVDQIGERVEGDDCITRTVWEDNGYPFLTDEEGNVWTREGCN